MELRIVLEQFEQPGPPQDSSLDVPFQRLERGRVAKGITDGAEDARCLRRGGQRRGYPGRVDERFLAQHGDPRLQRRAHQRGMGLRRRRDDDQVGTATGEQRIEGRDRDRNVVSRGEYARAR